MSLRELKPKQAGVDESLRLSKILISKNWTLPPRTTSTTAGGGVMKARHKKKDDSVEKGAVASVEQKKQFQNRAAQRAYRERKANKIKELEDSIESLQKLVLHWKNKYNVKEKELQELKKVQEQGATVDATAAVVVVDEKKVEVDETPSKCGFCNDDSNCVCTELEHTSDEKATISIKAKNDSVFSCSGSSDTCEKCSNIEETCIKPATTVTDTDHMVSSEIDFTYMATRNSNNLSTAIQLNNGATFQRIKRQMHQQQPN
ncbi:Yap5p [Maudiozyma barnettii]|uniref:Similar to Saccharomyces cerevisiae YIR018W YAP5 Basic leucine zipper (BZIP) transcription factor n=1 Tax=Maudiozyma barnettii TaxID=61262 RepID=A0A8H2ZKL4_9SACH|nr:Yap5p [Kazachstania barnettii]CAB4255292.1 similar to Saccharomyces cerevisiae YIR018W YAP5 Basic leucine zipper (bZIP) transcription factor [Kazachstania barnettii]